MATKRRMAAVGVVVAAAAVLGAGQVQAEPVTAAARYECGLNAWYTSEPYFGTLIHYLYKNCDPVTVRRQLYSVSHPEYPQQCHVIVAGQERYMGYASVSGFPPDRVITC